MLFFMLIKTILHTDWTSWILHFLIFYTLVRWSGIKPGWALLLVLGIEVWETSDWALDDPLSWWVRPDTWIDILTGILGIALAEIKNTKTPDPQKQSSPE